MEGEGGGARPCWRPPTVAPWWPVAAVPRRRCAPGRCRQRRQRYPRCPAAAAAAVTRPGRRLGRTQGALVARGWRLTEVGLERKYACGDTAHLRPLLSLGKACQLRFFLEYRRESPRVSAQQPHAASSPRRVDALRGGEALTLFSRLPTPVVHGGDGKRKTSKHMNNTTTEGDVTFICSS